MNRTVNDQMTHAFGFWYTREAQFVRFELLRVRNAWPVDITWFRD
ncbi:hypothetical protein BN137_2584 [Cronobacter condimenti 1330]|uniref:Uncharacterized protein n=1 Tax=Cronobacter condimenti 1330 TaxID=1073999 RepID=K8A175_9ENTR|nr:hypothetical protein [Cronobacter condimenti]CCJ73208.1 hypothetical protein BN137_2584 [Cronobacter condimenti 1330]